MSLGTIGNPSLLEIRQRYCEVTQNGKLPHAHYAKGLIIGDVGVGKSCVKNTLIGKPNSENGTEHTFGIKQDTIETYSASHIFHKVKESESEFSKVAAFLALYGKEFILSKVKSVKLRHLQIFCQALICFACLLMGASLHFGNFVYLYVICITGVLSVTYIIDVPHNLYKYGQHISIICVIMKVISTDDSIWSHSTISMSYSSTKIGILFIVCGILITGFFTGISQSLSFTAGLCGYFMLTNEPGSSECSWNDYETIVKFSVCSMVYIIVDLCSGYMKLKFESIDVRHGSIVCLLFAISYKLMPVYVTCVSFSLLFSFGAKLGRHFGDTQKYVNKKEIGSIIQYIIGFEMGIILSQYIDWQLYSLMLHKLMSLVIFCITEYIFWYQKQLDEYPEEVIESLQESGQKSWPVKVCLLDFAGSELFRDANQLFMGGNAIYMIVFCLQDAIKQPEYQLNRLIYWLNTVFAHTHYKNAKVILIGTNKNNCRIDEIKNFGLYLKNNLNKSFKNCLAVNKKTQFSPLFAIDNMESNSEHSDLHELHNVIWKFANDVEFTYENIPAQWFKFDDLLVHRRNLRKAGASEDLDCCIVEVNSLYGEVKQLHIVNDENEFYKLLEFHVRRGKIFYRMCDPRLFNYVVLDPQIIMDCAACLAGQYLNHIPTHLQLHWDHLEQNGIATREILLYLLKDIPGLREYYIAILQGLDLLVPVETQVGLLFSESDSYIIPFRLPLRLTAARSSSDLQQFYFDFGPFNPQMIFLNLIAKCFQMSNFLAEQRHLRISDHDWTNNLYKDCMEFYHGDIFQYKIENLQHCAQRNIFLVSVHKLDKSASILSLYGLLDGIILSLCKRDFPFVSYEAGIVCDCGGYHEMACRNINTTFNDIQRSFVQYECQGITKNLKDIHDITNSELIREQEISTHGIHSMAFISCSPDNRAWAQCELLPALQNILIPRKEVHYNTSQSQIMISYTATNEKSRLNQKAKNQQFIISSTLILVILSETYLNNCIQELYFAIKHCIDSGKRLVPILLDNCECPRELNIRKPLIYPNDSCGENVFIEFYLPLIKLFQDVSTN